MKKVAPILFILINSFIYAQHNNYAVYLGCYTNGDTIPDEALSKIINISLLKDGEGQNEASISTWEILIYRKGTIKTIKQYYGSPTIEDTGGFRGKDELMPQKIVVEGLEISIKQNDKITKRKLPPQTFYRAKTSSKKC